MAVDLSDSNYYRHTGHKALVVHPRTIYCSAWYLEKSRHEVDAALFGVSMHLSDDMRAEFFRQFQNVLYDQKARLWLHMGETFEGIASENLYGFAAFSTGRRVKGIFAPSKFLAYLERFRLVESDDIGRLVEKCNPIPGPVSENNVLVNMSGMALQLYEIAHENSHRA